jgi:hypothetical protein
VIQRARVSIVIASIVGSTIAGGAAWGGPGKAPAPTPSPAKAAPPPPPKAPAPAPSPVRPPADSRRIVGILDVRVEGVPPEIAAQFQSSLEAQVDPKHYWLAPRQRMHDLMANSTKWTEGCVIGTCLAEVKTQTGADLVLLASLTGSGTSFGFVVTLVRTDTGRVLAQESQRCDICTVNQVLAESTLAAVNLLNNVPDKLPDEATDSFAQRDLAVKPLQKSVAEQKHHRTSTGLCLTLTGLAVAAGGAVVYAVADKNVGLATAAAGGGVTLGGVFVLTF